MIAGLLSGDDNFGKVLATYLGLALEGFTGGGGAVRLFQGLNVNIQYCPFRISTENFSVSLLELFWVSSAL